MHVVLFVIMNHVIVFHYVNINLIIMHFAIKLIIIFLHVKNLCSDTFYSIVYLIENVVKEIKTT